MRSTCRRSCRIIREHIHGGLCSPPAVTRERLQRPRPKDVSASSGHPCRRPLKLVIVLSSNMTVHLLRPHTDLRATFEGSRPAACIVTQPRSSMQSIAEFQSFCAGCQIELDSLVIGGVGGAGAWPIHENSTIRMLRDTQRSAATVPVVERARGCRSRPPARPRAVREPATHQPGGPHLRMQRPGRIPRRCLESQSFYSTSLDAGDEATSRGYGCW